LKLFKNNAEFDGPCYDHGMILADGEWVIWILILLAIMVGIDRLRGQKPGFRWSNYEPPPPRPRTPPPPKPSPPIDGPGKFRIEGVDRATKMDTVWHVDAASEGNARAKAELEGIIVTRVDRV
jgi:hypothetical protein